ncbi:Tfp type 4 fimbrial pilin related signal peptide protein domain protein [Legionella birminghamensis]|uniref:Type II secretion system protein H n=1 Tax=Legionella birminghamensis TaxID=28083 RepID=A0A378I8K6_9GAMM|nr:GspH/FimT family pseudopilin [Legionella birminghamensis]KTC69285.1 Tfp type 4 fimbrial pilin related signal peptide protein domain protein [Legionella birminghamensis]STX31547.1 Tfp type 4 fimbrial pilin related signal peptide protein domain [Legionella birminghamensis]
MLGRIPVIRFRGFTLVESMICLTIILILMTIVSPLLKSNDQQIRLKACKQQLILALHFARNQALLSGKPLALRAEPDSGDWSKGMVLFFDNASHQFETNLLQHQWHWNCRNIAIKWHGFQSSQYLVFAATPMQAVASGRFELSSETQGIDVIINRLGRIRDLGAESAPHPL